MIPILCTAQKRVPILYNRPACHPRQNYPFLRGIWAPSNTWFVLGPTQVYIQNLFTIISAISAQLAHVPYTDTGTLHATSVATGQSTHGMWGNTAE